MFCQRSAQPTSPSRFSALLSVLLGSLFLISCTDDAPPPNTGIGGGLGGAAASGGSQTGATSGSGGSDSGGSAGNGGTAGQAGTAGTAGSTAGQSGSSGTSGGGNAGVGGTGGQAGSTGGSSGTAGSGGSGGSTPGPNPDRTVIYQIFMRHFGNAKDTNISSGTIAQNGSGKFSSINDNAITYFKDMGMTHIWLTGVIRHATLTPYPALGFDADDPDIVKGRAGSPYAITDYYDVDPDLADNPSQRMTEFESLVDRLHTAGLKVIIDFVPNHVSRAYSSTINPTTSFGKDDNRTVFFDANNNFFNLADPPGQALVLSAPVGWDPGGLDHAFAPENGVNGAVPRATGNNITSPSPSVNDWYETVKLNYGFNFAFNTTSYNPQPKTWGQMNDILAYWQAKGVDGFRTDFSHYVPVEFWAYALGEARSRNAEAFFMAEAYDNDDGTAQPGSAPGTVPRTLVLNAGFDAVYDHKTFGISRRISVGTRWANDFDGVRADDMVIKQYGRYIENHDERRAASPGGTAASGPGDTGYGTGEAGFGHAAAVFLSSGAPILVYAGQEVGEPGAGAEGFGGEDGRSTIFDYWSPPQLAALRDANYALTSLPSSEKALAQKYKDLIALSNQPAMRGAGAYYGLNFFNKDTTSGAQFGGNGQWVYAFLRYRKNEQVVLVLANMNPSQSYSPTVVIPTDALTLAGLGSATNITITELRGQSTVNQATPAQLTAGISVTVAPSDVTVLELNAQ